MKGGDPAMARSPVGIFLHVHATSIFGNVISN
jgi:hypothetical protein